jgi:hypothetical protein
MVAGLALSPTCQRRCLVRKHHIQQEQTPQLPKGSALADRKLQPYAHSCRIPLLQAPTRYLERLVLVSLANPRALPACTRKTPRRPRGRLGKHMQRNATLGTTWIPCREDGTLLGGLPAGHMPAQQQGQRGEGLNRPHATAGGGGAIESIQTQYRHPISWPKQTLTDGWERRVEREVHVDEEVDTNLRAIATGTEVPK